MTLPSRVLKVYLEGMTLVESDGATADIGNAQAYSVSELAFALKRTIEDAYGFVRLRGEISKVTRHASGHIYLTLKDERACIDAVVWKGSVRGLQCQPQTGLEVVVTGKITTYPARSSYQMVIETMEPAGIGALLAQLERLKTKLQAEGLFESHRKRALPTSPAVIGVITSPTGAVIRDILHRIRDRWPCHVVVWPVVVQGAEAAAQVAAAVKGFNAIDKTGALPRPEIIIIARGGGSIEDLWPFNDEVLARTVAAGEIPLISAVGHETDTTLIDFVSDRRAPTPSAAAEMATPVLVELKAAVANFEHRTSRCIARALELRRARLDGARRGLPRPEALLALANQRFDMASGRLGAGLTRNVDAHERQLVRAAARLSPHMLNLPIANQAQRLSVLGPRLLATTIRLVERRAERLERAERLLRSLHPEAPLVRGFALVRGLDGALVRSARGLKSGDALQLKFADGAVKAKVEGNTGAKSAERKQAPPNQGDLF